MTGTWSRFFLYAAFSASFAAAASCKSFPDKDKMWSGIYLTGYDSFEQYGKQPLRRDFRPLDQRVLNTPKQSEKDIGTLVAYLTGTAKDDLDKVRAIFVWIATRVEYDHETFRGGGPIDHAAKAQTAFTLRKAVCSGYARLFLAMAYEANLDAVQVNGFAYGVNWREDLSAFTIQTNHAWNAVRINGKWYLLDVTWAAVKNPGPGHKYKYFLLSPAEMIRNHLPVQKRLQFLPKPLSPGEFLAQDRR